MNDILFKQGFGPLLAGALFGGLLVYNLLHSPLPFEHLMVSNVVDSNTILPIENR